MKPARMTPLLNVQDMAASLAFYGKLGLSLDEKWERGDAAWCLLSAGDFRLMLNQTRRADSASRRAGEDYSELVLYMYVDDAPSAWSELQAQGVSGRHVGPQEYGLDEVWLRDPDGYHVVVASDVPDEADGNGS